MKEPTMEEMLELVEFGRDDEGDLVVENVKGDVQGYVYGNVWGSVGGNVFGSVGKVGIVRGGVAGDVWGDVYGNVWGSVGGDVEGTIKGQRWQFVQAKGGEE